MAVQMQINNGRLACLVVALGALVAILPSHTPKASGENAVANADTASVEAIGKTCVFDTRTNEIVLTSFSPEQLASIEKRIAVAPKHCATLKTGLLIAERVATHAQDTRAELIQATFQAIQTNNP